jgi:hypothetical protein
MGCVYGMCVGDVCMGCVYGMCVGDGNGAVEVWRLDIGPELCVMLGGGA